MAGKKSMSLDIILQAFEALNEELERRQFPGQVEMMIIGGVYMISQLGNRATTQDVDASITGIDMCYEPLSHEAKLLRTAIKAVGKRLAIPSAWLNDDASEIVKGHLSDQQAFQPRLWKQYSKLALLIPSAESILVLKIISYREKDAIDVDALCERLHIRTRERAQHLMDRYVAEEVQEEYQVQDSLNLIFD